MASDRRDVPMSLMGKAHLVIVWTVDSATKASGIASSRATVSGWPAIHAMGMWRFCLTRFRKARSVRIRSTPVLNPPARRCSSSTSTTSRRRHHPALGGGHGDLGGRSGRGRSGKCPGFGVDAAQRHGCQRALVTRQGVSMGMRRTGSRLFVRERHGPGCGGISDDGSVTRDPGAKERNDHRRGGPVAVVGGCGRSRLSMPSGVPELAGGDLRASKPPLGEGSVLMLVALSRRPHPGQA